MVVDAACIFDGFGIHGVWDKLNVAIGVRGAAANNAIPWILLTRSHICVAVWPSGKIQISPGKASFAALQAVESTLISQFNGRWMREVEFKTSRSANEILITYGAILLDQTCLEIIKVSERKAAREILDSLCSALVQTCDSIQGARPHLWDLALLQSATQEASACLELLSRRDVLASEEYVPAVVAMLDALREVVLVWRKALRASICKKTTSA
eukprot:s775_g2.t1